MLWHFLFEALDRSSYNGPLVFHNDYDTFIYDSHDRGPGRELFIRGAQDFGKLETALRLLRQAGAPPVNRMLDIGANIGTICIPAVKRGYVTSAIGVEAVPAIDRLFRINIVLNNVEGSVIPVNAAVSGRAGEFVEIAVNRGNQGDNRVATIGDLPDGEQFSDTIRIATVTLDDLLPDGPAGTLIWMDIQGHEGIALLGGPRTMAGTPPLVLEFCPALMQQSNSYEALKTAIAGYRGFYDLAHPGELRPLSDIDRLREKLGERGNFTDILVF